MRSYGHYKFEVHSGIMSYAVFSLSPVLTSVFSMLLCISISTLTCLCTGLYPYCYLSYIHSFTYLLICLTFPVISVPFIIQPPPVLFDHSLFLAQRGGGTWILNIGWEGGGVWPEAKKNSDLAYFWHKLDHRRASYDSPVVYCTISFNLAATWLFCTFEKF